MRIAATLPEVRYNLKSHDKNQPNKAVLIMAVFRYNGKKLLYTTGEKVEPKFWVSKKMRCKATLSLGQQKHNELVDINDNLDSLRLTIRSFYKQCESKDSLTNDIFRAELDYKLGRKIRPKAGNYITFYDFIENLIKERKKELHKKAVYGNNGQTYQKFNTSLDHLKEFAKKYVSRDLDYDDINEDFKDAYINYCFDDLGLSQNTVNKEIANVKQFLKLSKRNHSNKYYLEEDFSVPRIRIPKQFPTLDELKKLYSYDYQNGRLRRAADLYCLSGFGGGLRWSDIIRLNKDMLTQIDGKSYLHVFTYKGRDIKDNEVYVPFTPQLEALIKKYDWKFPKVTEQKANPAIRDAFKAAGLDRTVQVKSAIRGVDVKTKKLYEAVSFHTARYCYINYMMNELGVSAEKLSKITGQTIQVLLGYENGDKKKVASSVGDEINKNPKLVGLTVVKKDAI